MKYNPKNFGVTPLAKNRSKTKAEKVQMLTETGYLCHVDKHFPGRCRQRGEHLNETNVVAAHILAHSKGGDECVAMCEKCNAEQGTMHLKEFDVVNMLRMFEDHGLPDQSDFVFQLLKEKFAELSSESKKCQ
jgi:hypothetical protein